MVICETHKNLWDLQSRESSVCVGFYVPSKHVCSSVISYCVAQLRSIESRIMQLTGHESVSNSFILQADARSTRIASYDLCISKVIISGEASDGICLLKPQEMCVIISKERVRVPDGFVGYALPKTTLCHRGLLTLTTGIIDPGYDGLISTTAINFHREAIELRPGDAFLRIVFHELKAPKTPLAAQPLVLADDAYIKSRQDDSRAYPPTFLNVPSHIADFLKKVKDEVLQSLGTRFMGLVALTALLFTITNCVISVMLKLSEEKDAAKYVAEVHDITSAAENNANTLQAFNTQLQQQSSVVAALDTKVEFLRNSRFPGAADLTNLNAQVYNLEVTQADLTRRLAALEKEKP